MKILKFFAVLFFTVSSQAIELRRDTPFPFDQCDRSQYLSETPKATAYVTEMARRIMTANPSVFRDDLAFENFCIGIQYNPSGRAFAQANSRSFFVETGMLLRVQNDAQLAAVVAHELAHVALRHFHGGYPVSGPNISAAATRIRSLHSEIELPSSRNPEASARLNASLREQEGIINEAIAARYGSNAISNWVEAEADRVGAQFYLAAGFTSDELAWRPQQLVISHQRNEDVYAPPPQIPAQERINLAYEGCHVINSANMSEPERGNLRYPLECWSIWDLRHNAPATDSDYRTLMNDSRSIVNLELDEESNLAAVKEEVSSYEVPDPKASTAKTKNRMPASVKPEKMKQKNKKHPHGGCF